jgi:hypothetical protein
VSEPAQRDPARDTLMAYVEQWVDELLTWNKARPEATLSEIESHARLKRRELMSHVLREMLTQHGTGEVVEGVSCPSCGQPMTYKGKPGVSLETREAPTRIDRAYYHCPSCSDGLFPPGSTAKSGAGSME